MHFQRDWFFIILLFLFSLFGVKALFHPGLFTSHDGPHQVVRLYYYAQALKDGQLPPRYILDSLHGFGYPLFIFSYHWPWLLGAPLVLAGMGIYDTLKLLFALSFMLSALTMYFWQKRLWGGRWAGFIGAFLYLWAPYRFSDIFVRGSLGEAWTFVFLPLVFYRVQGQSLENPRTVLGKIVLRGYPLIGALGLAGLILSHSLVFMLALPAILLWWLFCSLREWRGRSRRLSRSVMVLSLGLGLSAFYLLPAFFLKQDTVFKSVMSVNLSDYQNHFPTLRQLLYSPWGYGFSFPGTNDGMSFQVGAGQWLAVFITVIMVITVIQGQPLRFARTVLEKKLALALVFLCLFLFSLFMMQPLSKPVWQLVNRFAYIDYPWRYLFLAVFSASVLAGFAISQLKSLKLPKLLKSLKVKPEVLGGVLLLLICLYTNRNHLAVNAWLDWDYRSFVGDGETSNTFEEYTPKWADNNYIKQVNAKTQNSGKDAQANLIEIRQGEGTVGEVIRKTNRIEFSLDNKTETDYRANVFYFPEVSIKVDGQAVGYHYQDKGVLTFSVPAGEHQVKIEYQRTNLEKVSLFISGVSLLIFLYLPIIIKTHVRKYKSVITKTTKVKNDH